jgi:phosphatidylinositol 3-kinase
MFKSGDDLRQDQLIMQMFTLMDKKLKTLNMDLCLTTFRVLATSAEDGVMEFVADSYPVSEVLSQNDNSILNFFRKHHPSPDATADYGVDPQILETYVKSTAGYCVLTYLLGIGDRHLENVMLKTSGHLFHLDFGFIFGRDPKPYPPPFKLTREMVEGMGGHESDQFNRFRRYCFQAYNWLRKSAKLFLNLLSLMVDAGIEDLSINSDPDVTLAKVKERFRLDLSDEAADHHFNYLINESMTAFMPQLMEMAHKIRVTLR